MAILRRLGTKVSGPRAITDAHRKRSLNAYLGIALLSAGAVGLVVGAIAWRIPPPEPVRITAAVRAALPDTSIFDSGVTLFATVPDHRNPPVPRAFGCNVSDPGGATARAGVTPIAELVGSRVIEGAALTAVVDLGHPARDGQVLCDGPAATTSSSLWVLPSKNVPSDVPLAIVVVALLLLGLGALVHPGTRSI
jgi:hypothetical protein